MPLCHELALVYNIRDDGVSHRSPHLRRLLYLSGESPALDQSFFFSRPTFFLVGSLSAAVKPPMVNSFFSRIAIDRPPTVIFFFFRPICYSVFRQCRRRQTSSYSSVFISFIFGVQSPIGLRVVGPP